MIKNISVNSSKDYSEEVIVAEAIKDGSSIEKLAWYSDNLYGESEASADIIINGVAIGEARAGSYAAMQMVVVTPPDKVIDLPIGVTSEYFPEGYERGIVIDWGDGSTSFVTLGSAGTPYKHIYATAAQTYTITISGKLARFGRDGKPYNTSNCIVEIMSFGNLGLTSLNAALTGQNTLKAVPSDIPSTVTDMTAMFSGCNNDAFNLNLNSWNVGNVTNMSFMFAGCYGAAFRPSFADWDTSSVSNMSSMFQYCNGASFNPDFSRWDTGSVTDMSYMFSNCYGAAFAPAVGNWDVSAVQNMSNMFADCWNDNFNVDVSTWNVGNVTNMQQMFYDCYGAAFAPAVGNWDVSAVQNMSNMFATCMGDSFNPVLGRWNVGAVTDMSYMFSSCYGAAFNPDFSSWDVSNVTNMSYMFSDCSGPSVEFTGVDLWTLNSESLFMEGFMGYTTLPRGLLDSILISWSTQLGVENTRLPGGITIDFGENIRTTKSDAAYAHLTTSVGEFTGWTINYGGVERPTEMTIQRTDTTFSDAIFVAWRGMPTSGDLATLDSLGLASGIGVTAQFNVAYKAWSFEGNGTIILKQIDIIKILRIYSEAGKIAFDWQWDLPANTYQLEFNCPTINWTGTGFGTGDIDILDLTNFRTNKMTQEELIVLLDSLRTKPGTMPSSIIIGDYADYNIHHQSVTDAVDALKAAKNITTVKLGE